MLLGAGDVIFDDMLDAGLDFDGIPQLPASAAAHLDDNAAHLGKSPTEAGFLGQLLWRKSTGKSQMSKRRDRVWNRVSRILRKFRSADREKATSSAHSCPLDGSHAIPISL